MERLLYVRLVFALDSSVVDPIRVQRVRFYCRPRAVSLAGTCTSSAPPETRDCAALVEFIAHVATEAMEAIVQQPRQRKCTAATNDYGNDDRSGNGNRNDDNGSGKAGASVSVNDSIQDDSCGSAAVVWLTLEECVACLAQLVRVTGSFATLLTFIDVAMDVLKLARSSNAVQQLEGKRGRFGEESHATAATAAAVVTATSSVPASATAAIVADIVQDPVSYTHLTLPTIYSV